MKSEQDASKPVRVGDAEITVLLVDGTERRLPMIQADLLVDLDRCQPVRRIRSWKGMRHIPGLYWSATTRGHINFESLLERKALLELDFDPNIKWIAAQPFRLHYSTGSRDRVHVPDFLVRLVDGALRVVNVKPLDRQDREAFRRQSDAMANACAPAGWDYAVVSDLAPVREINIRWLAGYRVDIPDPHDERRRMLEVAGNGPVSIQNLLERAFAEPLALPVLFGMLWRRELEVDLDSAPFSRSTQVRLAVAA